jgi:hypothetical protein
MASRREFLATMSIAPAALAQSRRAWRGPRPPKPDVPYLLHASKLLETEAGEAKEEKRRDDTVFAVEGAASPVKTPLAEPVFLILAEKLAVEKLELYKLTVKGGRREIVLPENPRRRREVRPVHTVLDRLEGNLYKLEANEGLDNGEYALTPAGSNQVFLFQVY